MAFQTLHELGQGIVSSVSEEEKTKIEFLLKEFKTSLHTLKQKIHKTAVDENVLASKSRDTVSLGTGLANDEAEDMCCRVETGAARVTSMNYDSDEEHCMLRGSSDGSQYGSDSGMGDSLLNTTTSEYTDGTYTKTPTVSPANNISQNERDVDDMSDSGDTITAELSPRNEVDIDEMVMASDQVTPRKCKNGFDGNRPKLVEEPDHATDIRDGMPNSNNLTQAYLTKLTPQRPVDGLSYNSNISLNYITHNALFEQNTDNIPENTASKNVTDILKDRTVLHGINLNMDTLNHGMVEKAKPSIVTHHRGQLEIDKNLDSFSYESSNLPCSHPRNRIDVEKSRPSEMTECKNRTMIDSRPFIPPKFLLPETTSTDNIPQNLSMNLPLERAPSDVSTFENEPNLGTSSQIKPLEYSSLDNNPRVHDIDEELEMRSRALQSLCESESLRSEQGLMDNTTEHALVTSASPPKITAEQFVDEPDALFQRLVDIEAMLKPRGKDEDNLKSALLKHVVSSVS